MTSQSDMKYSKLTYKKIDQFLGQYGDIGYGNLTVVADDILEELIINFDVYSCVVLNVTEERSSCFGLGVTGFWVFGECSLMKKITPVTL